VRYAADTDGYPSLLLTAAVFIMHFPALFLGVLGRRPSTIFDYLRDTVGQLAGPALIGWIAVLLFRWLSTMPRLGVTMERLLLAVSVFGQLRFDYALSQ
jgi:hypothetical protein